MGTTKSGKKVNYFIDDKGGFTITNYNNSKALANFFPGIAGRYGIPMWVFYVNRGQAINSFGTGGKDTAFLEFQPANKAWQETPFRGFRTFVKLERPGKSLFYEPFCACFSNLGFDVENRISMSSYDLKLEEHNKTIGLKTSVEYFTVPQDCYAGLARVLTIENTGRKPARMEVLDGLPQVVPYGVSNLFLKKLSRTIEAWMRVERGPHGIPLYKLDVDPVDRPQVIHIASANFYLGFEIEKSRASIFKTIVDPDCLFGANRDFSYPRSFLLSRRFQYPREQEMQCKTPCGFSFLDLELKPGEKRSFYFMCGTVREAAMAAEVVERIIDPGYIPGKRSENQALIEDLQTDVQTASSTREFDLYIKQTYLDNVMRGGYPAVLDHADGSSVFYLYSRKHGDLERDYNKFMTEPSYFSQGNGNYRDINQNRRSDVWLHPETRDINVITFCNLIQADGFNPLIVKGTSFCIQPSREFDARLKVLVGEPALERLKELLFDRFTPGDVVRFLEDNKISLSMPPDEFIGMLIAHAQRYDEADHGEGFWTDHWEYNLDLLDSYWGVYPEKRRELLLEKKIFSFYDNFWVVAPRSKKYVLYNGQPRQLGAVVVDEEKKKLIGRRVEFPHLARAAHGSGGIVRTTLINKFLCLFANKIASLDPFGTGIEMEANKPNWFDALNGLPALFGSSVCETFELKRLSAMLRDFLSSEKIDGLQVIAEIADFLTALEPLLAGSFSDLSYWDASTSLKEQYREKTRLGFSGEDKTLSSSRLLEILDAALAKLDRAIDKAKNKGTYDGYFINEVISYSQDGDHIKPEKFSQKRLPEFLETPMHAMRLSGQKREAAALYVQTKKGPLYDRELSMYRVTDSLKTMPEEIGRCRVFTPGWLENESIWLHMEYKYLLEVLKAGLYEEFFLDFKACLIPFQKPEKYGRSILENSSFVVSSAFPYKRMHGNGMVARLSGSTAEMLSIWLLMGAGPQPFSLDSAGRPVLRLAPILPSWLFDRKGTYSFTFLGRTAVTYHNPGKKDTFGKGAARLFRISFKDGKDQVTIDGDTIPSPLAETIRSGGVSTIDAYLR